MEDAPEYLSPCCALGKPERIPNLWLGRRTGPEIAAVLASEASEARSRYLSLSLSISVTLTYK